MKTDQLYTLYLEHPSVQTDTRKLAPGDLYFALRGPHFDGNLFAEQSLELGAAYAIIDDRRYQSDKRMILVDDVLTTLQQLARHHRDQFRIPFIAITGSNGKTTTKELIRAVLATTHTTFATQGNLNNHIGIPLTLLGIRPEVSLAVIEMGANHLQEIEGYCAIVNPTHGLITNIGKAHLEGFGGIEGVRKGKGELFDHLRRTGGSAFVCGDYDYFREMTGGLKEILWYGTDPEDFVRGSMLSADPWLRFETDYTGPLSTSLVGGYNLFNLLAAVAVGKYFKVTPEKIGAALATYRPDNARSQLVTQDSNTFILDAYNANPSSMKAAIENFAASGASKKVLLLGAMMELGAESLEEHRKLVALIGQYHWENVLLVGGDFANITHPYLFFPDSGTARKWVEAQHYTNTSLLVKGSRSIAMEKIMG